MKSENNVEVDVEVEVAQTIVKQTNRCPDEEGRTRVATDNTFTGQWQAGGVV